MQFWFVRSGEVSIREQIVTQVTLGILSDELMPGDRLPSTRILARRFHLHANTVSSAYRKLEADGWVESRHGSGVYVRDRRPADAGTCHSSAELLPHLFARFLRSADRLNIPHADVKSFIGQWLDPRTLTCFLLIESRGALREILVAEIERAVTLPVRAYAFDDPALMDQLPGAVLLALPSEAARVRSSLPAASELITLQVRSAASALLDKLPAPPDALIGIASAWPQFIETARTMLVATGVAPDSLVVRETTEEGWMDGLDETAGVVCDMVTANLLPKSIRSVPFPVLSESAIAILKDRERMLGLL